MQNLVCSVRSRWCFWTRDQYFVLNMAGANSLDKLRAVLLPCIIRYRLDVFKQSTPTSQI